MKTKSDLPLFLIAVVSIIPSLFYWNSLGYSEIFFSQVIGCPLNSSASFFIKSLAFWILPIVCQIFYSSNYLRCYLTRYGAALMVRGESRIKIVVKRCIHGLFKITILFLCQLVISLGYFGLSGQNFKASSREFDVVFNYFIFLLSLFLIQMLFELYIDSTIAHTVTIVVIVSMILVGFSIFKIGTSRRILMVIFPYSAMAANTGYSLDNIESHVISLSHARLVLLLLVISLAVMILKKSKKIEIY